MSISIYDFSVPLLVRGLTNLSAILDKAAAQAAAKKYDSAVLTQVRLFPDMHPLVRQVQIACDTAKGAGARLAQIEVPKHEDTEATFAELKARIANPRFPQVDRRGPGAGCGKPGHRDQVPERILEVHRHDVSDRLRAAEFLFSHQHGLRAAAQERH
jgi:hypothetical protein